MKIARIALNPGADRFLFLQVPDERTPTELFMAAKNDGALVGPDFFAPLSSIHHVVIFNNEPAQPQWGVPMTVPPVSKAN